MSRIGSIVCLAGLLLAARIAGATSAGQDYVFYHENVLGTSLELRVHADSEASARDAEARTLREIDRLAAILSSYDPNSEFRRWQATSGTPVKVSAELFELLAASDRMRQRSNGAFDPRVQALTDLWTKTAKLDRVPTSAELHQARDLMADPAWRLDSATGTAKHLTACPLTLNSIGKGFIIGRACEAALDRDHGVSSVLLNIGGDIRAVGDDERVIGIAPAIGDSESAEPVAVVRVKDLSVATSGNAQRGLRIRGQWYSHIFDPRTGRPAGRVISATVIGPRAAEANATATTLNVLPVDQGLALVAATPGVEALIVTADGQVHRSAGWAKYELALAAPLAASPADDAPNASAPTWSDKWELAINFEINNPEEGQGGRYRRPFVAIWIEDKDNVAVRTVALWLTAREVRWHPELKRWYRDDQVRRLVDDTNLISTISRPTRPPGKYSVAWDGKDDHGKSLPAGSYTVCIEASREHGTYQIIRKSITIGDKAFTEELKGNVEIKSASIDFRAKSGK